MIIPHCYSQRVNFTPVLEEKHGVKLIGVNYTLNSLILKCTDFAKVNFTLLTEYYDMLGLILLLPVHRDTGVNITSLTIK